MLIQNRHNHHMHRFLFASDATVMCAYSADDIYLPLTLFAEAELIHPIQFQSIRRNTLLHKNLLEGQNEHLST